MATRVCEKIGTTKINGDAMIRMANWYNSLAERNERCRTRLVSRESAVFRMCRVESSSNGGWAAFVEVTSASSSSSSSLSCIAEEEEEEESVIGSGNRANNSGEISISSVVAAVLSMEPVLSFLFLRYAFHRSIICLQSRIRQG